MARSRLSSARSGESTATSARSATGSRDAGAIAVAPDQYRGVAPPRDGDPHDDVSASSTASTTRGAPRRARRRRAVLDGASASARPGLCLGLLHGRALCPLPRRLRAAPRRRDQLLWPALLPAPGRLKPFVPLDVAGLVACPYLGLFGEIDPLSRPRTSRRCAPSSNASATLITCNLRRCGARLLQRDARAFIPRGSPADAWRRVSEFHADRSPAMTCGAARDRPSSAAAASPAAIMCRALAE